MHPDCSRHQVSWLEYGAVAHEGRSEARSKPNQVTGKYYGCHRLLVKQTSSQTCQGTPDTTVTIFQNSQYSIKSAILWCKNEDNITRLTISSEERASSPTTAFIACTSFPMA